MPGYHVPPLERLVDKFESLPGVGHKSAQRIAYYVLGLSREEAQSFAQAILDAHENIHYCSVCCNLTDGDLCPICRSDSRDKSIICVVEDPRDVFALERTNEFTPGRLTDDIMLRKIRKLPADEILIIRISNNKNIFHIDDRENTLNS